MITCSHFLPFGDEQKDENIWSLFEENGGEIRMWQVIYISSEQLEVKRIQELMQGEGFLVRMEILNDGRSVNYQLLVPLAEAGEALQLIEEEMEL